MTAKTGHQRLVSPQTRGLRPFGPLTIVVVLACLAVTAYMLLPGRPNMSKAMELLSANDVDAVVPMLERLADEGESKAAAALGQLYRDGRRWRGYNHWNRPPSWWHNSPSRPNQRPDPDTSSKPLQFGSGKNTSSGEKVLRKAPTIQPRPALKSSQPGTGLLLPSGG